MSLAIDAVKKACKLAYISYRQVDQDGLVLELTLTHKKHLIVNNFMGLLSDAEWLLFRDKIHAYNLFGEDNLFPKTTAFIDPDAVTYFQSFIKQTTTQAIIEKIEASYSYPVIVKRNCGTAGRNVFLCHERDQIMKALEHIYSKHQLEYDHVALAQSYVVPKYEYRLVVFDSKLEFAYQKPHHRPEFGGKVTPLLVTNHEVLDSLKKLVKSLVSYYPLKYAGIDVIEESTGKMTVIEINGSPLFTSFIKTNGDELVVKLFKKVITYLDSRTNDKP